ncbi:histidinol-phosphatase [Alkalilimnicola ehrlichii]|uniref:histidinol-phosphatase n=1 Tax=Alkalilimnicola ehrlichii TaxID=351052 RepID=UPI001C6E9E85|nr:histidinol-phosphatase [Alkalilimnicola ehrlichii]
MIRRMRLSADRKQELTEFAHQLADVSAEAILPYFRTSQAVNNKAAGGFDPVTVADREGERVMRALIGERYPEHGILGEEHGTSAGDSEFTWVLDPIDGTRAFITGLPLWGTLIALNDGISPVLGVMNQPFTGERFMGNGERAWLGDTPLATRECADLGDAILMCTTPEMFDSPESRHAFAAVAGQVRMLRYGGDCYAYCMLAMGMVDLIVERDLKPYDIQALIPIIEGAGGRVTNWQGESAQAGGR